jgi:hypothetical protein
MGFAYDLWPYQTPYTPPKEQWQLRRHRSLDSRRVIPDRMASFFDLA